MRRRKRIYGEFRHFVLAIFDIISDITLFWHLGIFWGLLAPEARQSHALLLHQTWGPSPARVLLPGGVDAAPIVLSFVVTPLIQYCFGKAFALFVCQVFEFGPQARCGGHRAVGVARRARMFANKCG